MKCPNNCTSCFGTTDEITCTECDSCYILENGKCKLFNSINEFCLTCDMTDPTSPKCKECDEGTYLNKENLCKTCGPHIKKCHENNGKIEVDEYDNKECQKGDYFKCLSCNTTPGKTHQCAKCNEGFYLPSDSTDLEKCSPCPEGCLKCSGTLKNAICTECLNEYMNDFMLYNGKCIKNCNTGSDELCNKCNTTPGENNRCLSCNTNYYLPDYSTDLNYNLLCKRCPNRCTACYGDYNDPTCTSCETGYVVRKRKCVKGCYFLPDCYSCDDLGEYPICTNCGKGMYFPSNPVDTSKSIICKKCSIPGCIKCEGETEFSDICLECDSKYTPLKKNGIIQSCSQTCEIGLDNKCKSCSEE